jgi:hypothetical protein
MINIREFRPHFGGCRRFAAAGRGLHAAAREREHVDQPAGAAGDVAGAHEGVELVADGWAGAGEELLADSEDRRQQIFLGFA